MVFGQIFECQQHRLKRPAKIRDGIFYLRWHLSVDLTLNQIKGVGIEIVFIVEVRVRIRKVKWFRSP